MQVKAYEKALLALRAYQAAKSDDITEVLCIACVFRNRVLKYGKTYTQVLENAEINRGWPHPMNFVMADPSHGVLAEIDGIYDNLTPDLTSNHLHKDGALHFGRVQDHQNTGDWFEENILKNPQEHALIGAFGVQNFYE
jgi:hypothetical protein